MKKRVAAITFGCKINQYETSCILHDFESINYEVADFSEVADVYLINSCTVTARTDFKSRNAVRHALKQKEKNPDVKIIVTGCYSQLNYNNVKEMGVDFIVDNNQKNKITDILKTRRENFAPIETAEHFSEQSTDKMYDRSRAFIKIQDGCDFFCHYCAIPYARGKSRSRDKTAIIEQINKLCENGYREFVLSGINLGLYQAKDGTDLTDLLLEIETITDVKLIRISSLEPQLFTEKLLRYYQSAQKLCPHFHIPLQTGSDELLKKMNRHYLTKEYALLTEKLLSIRTDTAIGMDIIAGLPMETDTLFEETYQFLETLPVAYLHVFSYSKRPGTIAASMSEQNDKKTIHARTKRLLELGKTKTDIYRNQFLNSKIKLTGIAEKNHLGNYSALSDHYLRVYFSSSENLEKKYLHFEPLSIFQDGLKVNIVD
jgi:threonylcarbamoyladenosine tRNA methylthiotransferase MtaB